MDLICYSHLRWNFVYQRPQHLMSRFAGKYRVFYVEEPVYTEDDNNYLNAASPHENLWVVVPHLKGSLSENERIDVQQALLRQFFKDEHITSTIFWYYTPMALAFSRDLNPDFIVYDCMDELSAFKFAPPTLKGLENALFQKADIVFTGGHNLYNAKKTAHTNIYPFPSSIDKDHFLKARDAMEAPDDHAAVPHPRFGFYGVIDERFDLNLIREVAEQKPDWHFVIIGPVIKIDEQSLPRFHNIHYLGSKTYNQLPVYLSGWDVAIIPFMLNDSTKYISPTKTPEYLAAGKPVISTSITDVVNPYAVNNLVHIADDAGNFIRAGEEELALTDKTKWLANVDHLLADISWDKTWQNMVELIENTMKGKINLLTNLKEEAYV